MAHRNIEQMIISQISERIYIYSLSSDMNSFRNVTLSMGSFELMLKTEICKEDKIR